MTRARSIVVPAVVAILAFAAVSRDAQPITVDLCTNPTTSGAVAIGTVLADQWRPIGILFDATPASVNPIMQTFSTPICHLFFNPDVYGVTAVFSFVVPGTTEATDATGFYLEGYYNPGESAQLVGLDEFGGVVTQDLVTSGDIGGSSQSLAMSISGTFRTVEWRTQGNPGIAASVIEFELGTQPRSDPIPALSLWGLLVFACLLAAGALFVLRR